MRSVFLDTNVLIYAATAMVEAPDKHAVALRLLEDHDCRLSAQVMAEFVSAARRKAVPPLNEDRIDLWLRQMEARDPLPVDAALVQRGTAISREHGLNYYDGAILAAAERLGCDTVLSEDITDGQTYGTVTVRNPFRDS